MKKLLLSLCLLAFVAITSTAFGQSAYNQPYPGATHTYKVNGGAVTGTNTYKWSVYKTTIGGDASGDYTMSNGANAAEKVILWAPSVTAGTVYYVEVVEETAEGCKNTKVLPVTIEQSDFYVSIAANSLTSCYTSQDVVVSLNGTEPEYDHGYTDVVYTVTPTNNQGNWKFNFASVAPNTDYSVTDPTTVTAGDATISGSTVTATSSTPVQLTFRFTRTVKLTNATDPNGTAANFDATVNISNGLTGATYGITDIGTSGTYEATTSVSRPATTGITGL